MCCLCLTLIVDESETSVCHCCRTFLFLEWMMQQTSITQQMLSPHKETDASNKNATAAVRRTQANMPRGIIFCLLTHALYASMLRHCHKE